MVIMVVVYGMVPLTTGHLPVDAEKDSDNLSYLIFYQKYYLN